MKLKTIKVTYSTWNKLRGLKQSKPDGVGKENFDAVIKRLIVDTEIEYGLGKK